jgi:hypothetical protein
MERHHRVGAHPRQKEREHRERAEERHQQPLLTERITQNLFGAADLSQRQLYKRTNWPG